MNYIFLHLIFITFASFHDVNVKNGMMMMMMMILMMMMMMMIMMMMMMMMMNETHEWIYDYKLIFKDGNLNQGAF